MEINIRKALINDAYDIAICHILSWQSAYKGIVPDEYLKNMLLDKEKLVERYRNNIENQKDCEYYCVNYLKKVIGWITINKNDETNIGEIWAIYLQEDYWGKGYGKIMLNFAINCLKKLGSSDIFLWVFEENYRARYFYEKNNFEFNGVEREVDRYGKPLIQLKYVLKNNV